MNVALIFAGGVGSRMNSLAKPKQFLELHGKPIIIYTLEIFQSHAEIDSIVVVCVADWTDYMKKLLVRYEITKVVEVVEGGSTGQCSIYNGLRSIEKKFSPDTTVIIHDGVRPLIDHSIISKNIAQVKLTGNAITTAPTVETFVVVDDAMRVTEVPSRSHSRLAKAPQSFLLKDILKVHRQALDKGITDSVDSCSLMQQFGYGLTLVEGANQNIKITTPTDYYIFRAIVEARENSQIFGG
ncbi:MULTISPECIES: 2-C-methyl-D-erythritol 4-phosphate cytidylyltransferase [unclassified Acinetobacter]|uniref:IspD/TarI family cytidylyltransferase n=1 Tax=unclassified Acinetobacter TaxID=196816 RepID=UPI0015D1C82B|nr:MULTISPECIES: IspD/TarI family cytidylyltransferase [unclassified Acinetobacter]